MFPILAPRNPRVNVTDERHRDKTLRGFKGLQRLPPALEPIQEIGWEVGGFPFGRVESNLVSAGESSLLNE